ncbi:DUF3857 domain-containing protein [Ancylomarina sp.]|uniref:DUF3857 domain-containing protein n=1 Tax=Ancylomarina sp. TaxID=1970196 RepID=UPI003565F03D
MNKAYIPLIVLFLLSSFGFSQQNDMKIGIINPYEQNLKTYKKDPKADAVVVFDIGKSIFFDTDRGGYNIRFTRKKRIKILDKSGIKFSEVSIPFYVDGFGKTEYIKSIEAYCYNIENGILIKKALDQSTIFEEQINNNWKTKKFVFPDVKEGSIIEYKYVLETPFLFNLPDWAFQSQIPTIYSEYNVNMIPFYEYAFIVQGISRFDRQESVVSKNTRTWGTIVENHGVNIGNGIEFKDKIHLYAMKDIPAFRDKSYISSAEDYLMKMDFQLAKIRRPQGSTEEIISTWPRLCEDLLDHDKFGKYLKKSGKLAKKILEYEIDITDKNETNIQKAIINYIKTNFDWNGVNSKYASKKPKEFYEQKTGNSTDINLFMCALLKTAGIDAQPIILSTRNNGKIKGNYSFSHFFNYTIVMVKGDKKSFLTDGTNSLIAYNRIPIRCINGKGLLVNEDQTSWISLYNNIKSLDTKILNIDINTENLSAETKLSIHSNEFESLGYKKSYKNDTIKLKKQLMEKGLSEIHSISTLNYERNNLAYIINCKGESPVEKIGNKLIVLPFLDFPIKENKLKELRRAYPVDLIYARTKTFESKINIPDGYQIKLLPKNYLMDNGLAEIKLEYVKNENNIVVQGTYSFKKSIYKPQEYGGLKNYFNTIIKKFNEPIVFEEIN